MSRANGGVATKVTNNAGQGSVERGGGMAGKTTDQSVQRGTIRPDITTATPREEDQSQQRGPYGSTIQAGQGTVKDMGGVGNY